jgi:uncharacterized protein (DUF2126 family)/transglutaminase-like putative cysteine protease
MTIHVALEHRTTYRYDRLVRLAPHVVRLRPAPHCRTPILAYSLHISPEDHFINWQQDPFGNYQARLVFPEPTRQLIVTVDTVVDLTVIDPFDFFIDDEAITYPFAYDPGLALDLAPYLALGQPGSTDNGPLLREWVAGVPRQADRTLDFLVELNRRVFGDVAYTVRMDPGVQTPDETLDKQIGSCRDSAWLLVQILRHLGLAARFASGYLVQLASDVAPVDGPAGPASDFTDLHAWAEAYIPGAGWIGLDPTSGLLAGEGHIPLACTPRPAAAAPITGAVEACETTFEFSNLVRRVREDRPVTRPYSEEEWARIDALGHDVDRLLQAGDTRLTMGGEPTFVSVDDREGPEWNTAADGPAKRALGMVLARQLAARFAPNGLLHHGQGKWYPGEPLPRWQMGVHWLHDGEPLWHDVRLLADPTMPGDATAADAAALVHRIAVALGIPADCCIPAYEDPLYRLWSEARLPAGPPPVAVTSEVDPTDPSLRHPDDRMRLVAALDADRGEPRGYALPLHRPDGETSWSTARWTLRRGHLFLVPGESPMGLRLPLDSLTWTPPPPEPERSRFDTSGRHPRAQAITTTAPLSEEPPEPPVTKALCVERREGHLCVFLPPVTHLEDAMELLNAIEGAAAALDQQVVIEGYPLPADPRARHLEVTPDPGVIEVNVHPTSSWPEMVEVTTVLFEETHRARLGTDKFALDGSHTGTGGGGHLTLGGLTPADSPLLRRPDLLRSLVTYWQHHPSLSYLFAGRFIGPTSQSPRVDEGRSETLYELEIAFAEMDRLGKKARPWHVDRLLRHLLVDITGNTHRSEFCVDKLFSPDTERGRMGLLELRGFEMPPHPRLALVQALLVRALVARFWADPYAGTLIRWGTELHDRFLLPWFVASDMGDVVDDLNRHGIAFEASWVEPFLEFRFPRLGAVQVADVNLELRMAIEPWNVLGEEVAAAATARYVDSSVERLQVRVDGLTETRHLITCNQRRVPLQPTATPGTYVAGLRYRAWQPPSALHPTIGVHAPLVFDVVDRWSGRSLGGCTYHVSHPGGRAYERLPVNANEAEARRVSRFVAGGHTPGPVDIGEPAITDWPAGGEYPRTLDLRRPQGL